MTQKYFSIRSKNVKCVCVCLCVGGGRAERRYLVDIHWSWKILFEMTEMIFCH